MPPQRTGSVGNPWIAHVRGYAQAHGCSYGKAMKLSAPSYRSGATRGNKKESQTSSPVWYPEGCAGERLVALAMHFTPRNSHDSDTIRLQSVLKNTRVKHVCGVGETDDAQAGNIALNFKGNMGPLVTALAKCNPTIGVLDYFWLENHYYDERYGRDWPDKLRTLFTGLAGLHHFILPMDRLAGELAIDFGINRKSSDASFDFPGMKCLHCYLLTPEEGRACNPLVVATMLVKKKLLGLKGAHASKSRFDEAQQLIYLARDYPFLLVSRSATRKEALTQLRAVCSTPAPAPDIPQVVKRQGARDYVLRQL